MFTAYANFWKQYVDFKGRTKRAEFWWPFLFNTIIRVAFNLIYYIDLVFPYQREIQLMKESALPTDGITLWTDISPLMIVILVLYSLFELAILVPSLAIGVRRFRDAAFHWAFIFMYGAALLLCLIPYGWIPASLLMIACIVLWIFPSREKKAKVPNFGAPMPNQFVANQQQNFGYQQVNPTMVQNPRAVPAPQQQASVNPQVNPSVPQANFTQGMQGIPVNPAQQPAMQQGQPTGFNQVPQQNSFAQPSQMQNLNSVQPQEAPQPQVAPQGQMSQQGQAPQQDNPFNPTQQ